MGARVETIRSPLSEADSWVYANLGLVVEKMDERIRDRGQEIGFVEYGSIERISRGWRWRSEMTICRFWEGVESLPSGFSMIDGRVTVGDYDPQTHVFLLNSSDIVFCLTPGQFVRPVDLEFGPGERISILQEQAGDNIRIFDRQEGVAALCGSIQEIESKLGMRFGTTPVEKK